MAVPLPRYRFTVAEYEAMGRAGILGEDARVELVRGEVIQMSPVAPRHADSVAMLNRRLTRQVPDDVLVLVQSPIRLPDNSEPEPDLALVRFARYTKALPTAADVLVVIEVADSSRDYDRAVKLPLYAAAGIPEAWFADLVADRVERHTEPGPDGYQQIALVGRGKTLTSTVLPGVTIAVDEVLSPPMRS